MKAATQRKILRWMHIILSIPIVGYIYGPLSKIPEAAFAVRYIFFPVVVISGFWMWKAHLVSKWFQKRYNGRSAHLQ
jgi:hypothetical protein